jgi:hypothetical protein
MLLLPARDLLPMLLEQVSSLQLGEPRGGKDSINDSLYLCLSECHLFFSFFFFFYG